MTKKVGVFRQEKSLVDAISIIQNLKERAENIALSSSSLVMNQELIQRWELDNLLQVSESIAYAALQRKESRGGHAREDYPERSDAFHHHTLVYMDENQKLNLEKKMIDMSIFEDRGEDHEKFKIMHRKY